MKRAQDGVAAKTNNVQKQEEDDDEENGKKKGKCFNKMLDFENQFQSIQVAFNKQSEKTRSEHRIRLEASTNVARFLLKFGLSFRGHDAWKNAYGYE
ncbi:hypothetical protein H5410_046592 [Solanum commersonii]|uniref:DUF4371 domain-containing protein n=1 Tax=Solanum commersonii TaxID=4109 RepID=A0A9J5XG51_SOLCO|nr:hypothetical protein H5410_046592 [Solanum commersonii]